jgi:xanthine phosphoribosyltransferase
MIKKSMIILSLVLSSTIMCTAPEIKKTYIDLEQIKSMCFDIYHQVQDDNFKPDLLVIICRGGLNAGGLFAGEAMFNNRNVVTISLESYSDDHQRKDLKLRFPFHVEDYKNFKSILVIDDIVDTGETVEYVITLLKDGLPTATIKTAALFYKPKSKIKPDYYVAETNDWIVFPWEI